MLNIMKRLFIRSNLQYCQSTLKFSGLLQNASNLERMRHSTAHVLAMTVQSMFDNVKIAIGPVTEDGF